MVSITNDIMNQASTAVLPATYTINIGCPSDTLPSASFKTLLKETFSQLGGLAEQLYIAGYNAVAEAVKKVLAGIDVILGIFPISFAKFYPLEIPEWEWGSKMEAILCEYKLYVQTMMLSLIAKLIPVSLEISILGLKIDLVQLFSNAEYRSELLAQIGANINAFLKLIPKSLRDLWNGNTIIISPSITISKIWKYIVTELKQLSYKLLWDSFGALIKKFKKIWKKLGLPALPDLMEIDWDSLIESVQAPIKAVIASIKSQISSLVDTIGAFDPGAVGDLLMTKLEGLYINLRDSLLNVSIFGFSLGSILEIDLSKLLDETVTSINDTLDEWSSALQSFANEWPQYLLEKWVVKIKKFLDKIGLGALLDWAKFSVCQFLQMIGLPTSISIPIPIKG